MLDRVVVRKFLESQLDDINSVVPDDLDLESLAETFCQYAEEDYYEWLKDNFKSFFSHGDVDWEWVRRRVNQ